MTHDILVVGAGPAGLPPPSPPPAAAPACSWSSATGHVDLPARHRRQHPDDGDLPLWGVDDPVRAGELGVRAAVLRVADAADRAPGGPAAGLPDRRARRARREPDRCPRASRRTTSSRCCSTTCGSLGGEVRFGVELVELATDGDGVHADAARPHDRRARAGGRPVRRRRRRPARRRAARAGHRADPARHARRVRQRDLPGRSRPGRRRPPLRAVHHREPGRGRRAGARRRRPAGATRGSGSPSAASRPTTSRRRGASS